MASIRIDEEARRDPRLKILGQKIKTSRFDAFGRMCELWAYCTEKGTLHLEAAVIDVLAECDDFHTHLCAPEVGLAQQTKRGIYLTFAEGRVEWLTKARNNGKKGGRPKKTNPKPTLIGSGNQPLTNPKRDGFSSEGVLVAEVVEEQPDQTTKRTRKAASSPDTSETWKAYGRAFERKYGAPPVRNAAVNSKMLQFVKRLGTEEAPHVAEFYVGHSNYRYVNAGHAVGLLLQDAEKLRTEWATGHRITQGEARQQDRRQTTANAFGELLIEAEARQNGKP